MAIFAFTDAVITIGGTAYSGYAKEISIEFEADDLETTAFGSTWRSRIGGLKNGTVSITFNQDYVDNGIDEVLFGLLGTVTAIVVKPTSAAKSAANPEWTFSALVTQWTPLDGAVGDLAEVKAQWPITGAVTRVV